MRTRAPAGRLMRADMAEQPAVLRRILGRRDEISAALRSVLPHRLRGFALVGRGSSENAALFGRYLLELCGDRPATIVPPSFARLYGARTAYDGFLAIGLSQSGATPEVATALRALRAGGATTVALTADPESPLASPAHLCLDLATGTERAIPATKTFTAELALLIVIAESIGGPWSAATWERTIDAVDDALSNEHAPDDIAMHLADATHVSVVSAGLLVPIAIEAALKIEEAAAIPSTGISAAGLRHGPVAAAAGDRPVLALQGPGAPGEDVARIVAELRARGLPVYEIGVFASASVALPSKLPEAFIAIIAAVRAQQIASALALRRGRDPDHPRAVSKVTLT